MKDSFASRFFLLAFLITWGAWGLLVLNGTTLDPGSPRYLLFLLGGFGPSLAGLIMTAISDGRTGLRDLWRRTIRFKFGLQWYLIIFLLFPVINALTLVFTNAIGGPPFDFALALSLSVAPNLMVPVFISFFLFGALAEEFGWRGYALDRLQARFGPALGSLLLGVLWGVWHLPLFYISGAPQHDSGLSFILFFIWIVALSPIYTWIYNGTGRSLAAILLLHWISTIAETILPTAQRETLALAILSTAILVVWFRQNREAIRIKELSTE
jgi:uncharacterized protein